MARNSKQIQEDIEKAKQRRLNPSDHPEDTGEIKRAASSRRRPIPEPMEEEDWLDEPAEEDLIEIPIIGAAKETPEQPVIEKLSAGRAEAPQKKKNSSIHIPIPRRRPSKPIILEEDEIYDDDLEGEAESMEDLFRKEREAEKASREVEGAQIESGEAPTEFEKAPIEVEETPAEPEKTEVKSAKIPDKVEKTPDLPGKTVDEAEDVESPIDADADETKIGNIDLEKLEKALSGNKSLKKREKFIKAHQGEKKEADHVVIKSIADKVSKVKEIRRKKELITIIVIIILVAVYILYVQFHTFTDFRSVKTEERYDTAASHFLEYGDGFVKYSNDGISYVTTKNVVYWNQSFEMENPKVAICDDYVAVADRLGDDVYIMNKNGLQGQVTVNMPILEVEIASQGTVAVLMESEGTSYLALYDANGSELAEGAIHAESGGTPIDLALSHDGKKLCASVLDVAKGVVGSTLYFYNFGAVGQNEVDNIVSTYTYPNVVIQKVAYVSNDTMLAFGDNVVRTYTGSDIPEEDSSLEIDKQIQSIFYDDAHFGLIFVDDSEDGERLIDIYNLKCGQESEIQTDIAYDNVYFMDNHEICLYNTTQCRVYTVKGHERFHYDSSNEFYGMYHLFGQRTYLIFGSGETYHARLRLIDWHKLKEAIFSGMQEKQSETAVPPTEGATDEEEELSVG